MVAKCPPAWKLGEFHFTSSPMPSEAESTTPTKLFDVRKARMLEARQQRIDRLRGFDLAGAQRFLLPATP
jgi:hypothetical protein